MIYNVSVLPVPQSLLCKKCGIEKPSSDFSPSKRHKYRKFPWCKPCNNKYTLQRKVLRATHPEKYPSRTPVVNGMKVCTHCKIRKSVNEFWRHYNSVYPFCKACKKAQQASWRVRNPEKYKAQADRRKRENRSEEGRFKRYGITKEQYASMVEWQHGECAICGLYVGMKLYVDHNHKTGKVRGLLCKRCNFAIGALKEDLSVMAKAMEYVRRYNGVIPDSLE